MTGGTAGFVGVPIGTVMTYDPPEYDGSMTMAVVIAV
jgi:hypothetical protein